MARVATTPLLVDALGVIVSVQCENSRLDDIRWAWADAIWTEADPSTDDALHVQPFIATSEFAGATLAETLHRLSPVVTVRAIAANAGTLLMLHGAALADPATGATAVLVAPSGTGKTTACLMLAKRFAYLTDETAAITADGVVLPYRKPLSLVVDGPFKLQRSPSELRLVMTERECRVGAVVLLDRRAEHTGEPVVTPLETVDAIAALAPECSYLSCLDSPLHRMAHILHLAGGAHRITYREAASIEPAITALLAMPR